MKIKEITVHKQFKFGLPNYSNITASCGIVADVGENEKVDWEALWEEVNQQLSIQSNSFDPSWITTKEYKKFFKTTIKTEKGGDK